MFLLTFICHRPESRGPLLEALHRLKPLAASTAFSDEIQVALKQPEQVVKASLLAAGRAWVGIGVGSLEVAEDAAPVFRGEAAEFSRVAVELARTGSPVRNISLVAAKPHRELAEQVGGILRLLYRVVAERSEAEQRVISYLVPGVRGQHKSIAQVLKISPQAVSKALVRAKWHEEQAAYPGLILLLSLLQERAAGL